MLSWSDDSKRSLAYLLTRLIQSSGFGRFIRSTCPHKTKKTRAKKGDTEEEGPTQIGDIYRSRVLNDASRTANSGGPSGPDPFACAHLR